jgi:ERCC4-related helicase
LKDGGDTDETRDKLTEVIHREYSSNPDTRTLVFVATRNLAMCLSDFLNNSEKLKEFRNEYDDFAAFLTSTNASQKVGGLSLTEQRERIKQFDQGLLNFQN